MLERIKADLSSDQEQKAIIETEINKIEREMLLDGDFFSDEVTSSFNFSSVVFEPD